MGSRRLLHLTTLYETARELGGMSSPREVMDAFLLTAMGPLGATRGFVLTANRFTREILLARRGLEPDEADGLGADLEKLLAACFPDRPQLPFGGEELFSLREFPAAAPAPLPPDTRVLAAWTARGGMVGVLGLSGRLEDAGLDREDQDFLQGLAGTLANALKTAQATERIRRLNLELAAKNAELEEAAAQADAARSELAQRAYHLKTLYDASRELAPQADATAMAESFLLLCMGALSARQGLVLVRDDREGEPVMAARGVDPPPGAALSANLAKAFAGAEGNPIPMSCKVLADKRLLAGAGLPFPVAAVVLFAVDDSCQGLLALGPPLSDQSFSLDERELLAAHAAGFLVFLGKARNFAAAERANRDLAQRNQELQRLLEEITQCRLDLEGEKRHKAHIISFVERQTSRVRSATRLDYALILALSLLLGLVFNASNPAGVDLAPAAWSRPRAERIDAGWASLRRDSGAVFVDARPAEFYARRHVKGAVNLPASLFDFVFAMRFSRLSPDTEIIVYGSTISRLYDEQVAFLLADRGLANVKVMDGGLDAWTDLGQPVEEGK
ncbi:MAG: rhodanese-like domain-containing protein [Thermodesulfobacteriota bacterium]